MPRSKITPHLIDRAQFNQRQPSSFKLHSPKATFAGVNVQLSERHYKGVADAIAKYGFSQKNYSILIKIVHVWLGDTGIELVDRVFKDIKNGTVSPKEAKEKFLELSKQEVTSQENLRKLSLSKREALRTPELSEQTHSLPAIPPKTPPAPSPAPDSELDTLLEELSELEACCQFELSELEERCKTEQERDTLRKKNKDSVQTYSMPDITPKARPVSQPTIAPLLSRPTQEDRCESGLSERDEREVLRKMNKDYADTHSLPDLTPKTRPISGPTIVKPLPVCVIPEQRIPHQLFPLTTYTRFLYKHTMTINGVKKEETMHFTVSKKPHQQATIKIREANLSGADKRFSQSVYLKNNHQIIDVKDIAQV